MNEKEIWATVSQMNEFTRNTPEKEQLAVFQKMIDEISWNDTAKEQANLGSHADSVLFGIRKVADTVSKQTFPWQSSLGKAYLEMFAKKEEIFEKYPDFSTKTVILIENSIIRKHAGLQQ